MKISLGSVLGRLDGRGLTLRNPARPRSRILPLLLHRPQIFPIHRPQDKETCSLANHSPTTTTTTTQVHRPQLTITITITNPPKPTRKHVIPTPNHHPSARSRQLHRQHHRRRPRDKLLVRRLQCEGFAEERRSYSVQGVWTSRAL